MSSFKILKTQDIMFGQGEHFAIVTVQCNNCNKSFSMHYHGTCTQYGLWTKKYEYSYCPHCGSKFTEVK